MKKKIIIYIMLFAFILTPALALAQDMGDYGNLDNVNLVKSGGADATSIAVTIINWILGFLALIAVVIILIGGFEWMTAGGSEDKVKAARDRIKYGLIGLGIVLLAYVIVTVVMRAILDLSGQF